jgi:hypothetical protein
VKIEAFVLPSFIPRVYSLMKKLKSVGGMMGHFSAWWRRPIPGWMIFTILFVASGFGVALLLTLNTPMESNEARPLSPVQTPLPAGTYSEEPLVVGTKAPEFVAAGWVNGEPAAFGTPRAQLLVLDIWARW